MCPIAEMIRCRFLLGNDGRLSLDRIIPCGGVWPRNFALMPDGAHMLVANQYSHQLSVVALGSGETAVSAVVDHVSCVVLVG